MKDGRAQQISNVILSGMAGFSSFVFSLAAFLYVKELDAKVVASIVAGLFCLMISYIASERPNSSTTKAMAILAERLLAVEDGDLTSPAPELLRNSHPKLDAAVDSYVRELLTSAPEAITGAKRLIAAIADRPPADVAELTAQTIARHRVSPEGQEGMRAFLDKRPARWTS